MGEGWERGGGLCHLQKKKRAMHSLTPHLGRTRGKSGNSGRSEIKNQKV